MVRLVDSKIYDVKMFEQIYVNRELILEQFIEPNSTVKFNMENILNKEMRQALNSLERRDVYKRQVFGNTRCSHSSIKSNMGILLSCKYSVAMFFSFSLFHFTKAIIEYPFCKSTAIAFPNSS